MTTTATTATTTTALKQKILFRLESRTKERFRINIVKGKKVLFI